MNDTEKHKGKNLKLTAHGAEAHRRHGKRGVQKLNASPFAVSG
jgi:hypothetical protein